MSPLKSRPDIGARKLGSIMSKQMPKDQHHDKRLTRITATVMIAIVTLVVIAFVGLNLHDVKKSSDSKAGSALERE